MERDTLTDIIGRMNRQIQYIQRIHDVRATYIQGIHIGSGVEVVLIAPSEGVAFADILIPCAHLHVRRIFLHTYAEGVDTIATRRRSVRIGIETGVGDQLTTPVKRLTRDNSCRVMTMETTTFLQHVGDYRVATRARSQTLDDGGRTGISLTIQRIRFAERNDLRGALERLYLQTQLVDTVFACAGLVFNKVIADNADALVAEVIHTVPTEVISLANRRVLDEMILRLVLREDQAPEFATSGRCIRTLVLVGARLVKGLVLLSTVVPVRPGVTVVAA